MPAPMVIISGGSEAATVPLVEWALRSNRSCGIFRLGRSSIFEGVAQRIPIEFSASGSRRDVLNHLAKYLVGVVDTLGVLPIVHPTEDDSLGLLVDLRRTGEAEFLTSICEGLKFGGIDKAELFEVLQSKGLDRFVAETSIVRDSAALKRAISHYDGELVLKPSRKPWGGSIPGGVKAYTRRDLDDLSLLEQVERSVEAGDVWIAQRRLSPLLGGERSACVVRSEGVRYAEVIEVMKYPSMGGTACWVETQRDSVLLMEASTSILQAIDAKGIIELSFLADASGNPRLLELNPRPWLQMELLIHAGFDLLGDAEKALSGEPLAELRPDVSACRWINAERLVLRSLQINRGGSGKAAMALAAAFSSDTMLSVWSSRVPGVRFRWAQAMGRKLLTRLRVGAVTGG